MEKCRFCKKLHNNMKFCSHSCHNSYDKKHKINRFNPKLQSKLGKVGGKRTHELHPNLASEMGKKNIKKSLETSKREKKGFWDSEVQRENGRKGIETQRRKKIGPFFNPDVHREIVSKAGKIGGPIVAKILREKRNIKFNRIYFASFKEAEIGLSIYYQIEKLVEGKNYQKNVDGKLFDFFIKKYNLFIEYHPLLKFFNPNETDKSYYQRRRKILNKNGYKDYPLLVIK